MKYVSIYRLSMKIIQKLKILQKIKNYDLIIHVLRLENLSFIKSKLKMF